MKKGLFVSLSALLLVLSGVVFTQSIGSLKPESEAAAVTALAGTSSSNMSLTIDQSGNTSLEGQFVNSGASTISVKTWDGTWTVNIAHASLTNQSGASTTVSTFLPQDHIIIQGTVSTSTAPLTLTATLVTDETVHTTLPANVIVRLDPNAPSSSRIVITSAATSTPNVTLGIFDFKSGGYASTLKSLTFTLRGTAGANLSSIFNNLYITVNGQTYAASLLSGSTTATFNNLTVSLPKDVWTPVTVEATVAPAISGIDIGVGLNENTTNISGADTNGKSFTVNASSSGTGGVLIGSQDTDFTLSGLTLSNPSASIGTCTGATNTTSNNKCSMTMSFTLTNLSNSDVFINKTPALALATSSSPNTASTTLQLINIPVSVGDTSTAYDVSAGGSRTFTYNGTFSQIAGGGFETFKITTINYVGGSITAGLGALSVSQTL